MWPARPPARGTLFAPRHRPDHHPVSRSEKVAMRFTRWAIPALSLAGALAVLVFLPAPAKADAGQWEKTVDRAVDYLRATQARDGSWDSKVSPGITGIVVTGLLRTGRVSPKDPMIQKALKYIESLINT